MTAPIPRVEPEMPLLTREYFLESFREADLALQRSLAAMQARSEAHREHLLPEIAKKLRSCDILGHFAEVSLPTPAMADAQEALSLSIDS